MPLGLTRSLLLAVVGFGAVGAVAGAGPPQVESPQPHLPQSQVDTSEPTQSGRVLRVAADGDFPSALAAANPGDTIVLAAGAVYRGPFTLPPKSGSAWIVVTTDAGTSLPPFGSRIDPSFASLLPKLVASSSPVPAAPRAGRYRFVGVEITPEAGQFLTNLAVITSPDGVIFDRCYVHGDSRVGARRGIALNGGTAAVVNSYVSDIKEVGADSQAIAGWDGAGPFAILNNHLEASGENVLFGGADPSTPNLVPSDIEIRHNHFTKPLSWKIDDRSYAGTPWTVKNLFELKNARRVLVDGNVFEFNWPQAQNGYSILFTVRNQDGHAPWSTVEDVTFSNNIVRHVAGAMNILGWDDINQSLQTHRVLIRNNLFDDVGGIWGQGQLFQLLNGTADVIIDHNTAAQSDSFVLGGDSLPHERFVFRNNIVLHNLYGLIGSDTGIGLPSLARYFPGAVFLKNAIVGGAPGQYPPGNFFPRSFDDVGFADWRGHDYRLTPTSPLRRAGTDGADVGADAGTLTRATAGVNAQPAGPAASRPEPQSRRPPVSKRRRGAEVVFGISACLLAYTYAGYPIIIATIARLRPRKPIRLPVQPRTSIL